jgi:hypothetical protein
LGAVAAAGLLAWAAAGVVSCTRSRPPAAPSAPQTVDAASRGDDGRPAASGGHWVHDAKVRALMQHMSRGKASWPNDLPSDPEAPSPPEPSRTFADAAVLADLLAGAASDIPRSAADRPMPVAKRAGFAREAETLRRHALELKNAAGAGNVEQMHRALDQINATCFACHSQYRDLAGELTRASPSAPGPGAASLHAPVLQR